MQLQLFLGFGTAVFFMQLHFPFLLVFVLVCSCTFRIVGRIYLMQLQFWSLSEFMLHMLRELGSYSLAISWEPRASPDNENCKGSCCNQRRFLEIKRAIRHCYRGSVPLTGPSVPLAGGSVPLAGLF